MKVPRYAQFGGANPETAAVRNVLAHAGVVAPHTGEPFTEAMLLGVGGGLGAGYFVIRYGDVPGMAIGTRHLWYDMAGYIPGLCKRLGVTATVQETSSAKAGLANLEAAIAAEKPVIAWLDLASLPYAALPAELVKGGYHVAVVFAHDAAANVAQIADRSSKPLTAAARELAAARAAITSFKHRTATVAAPKTPIDLAAAVRAGVRACCDGLARGRLKNFTLDAFHTWGTLVGDAKSKDSWARTFPPGPAFYSGLVWTFRYIEQWSSGGQALRGLYAEFLDEAAAAIDAPALAKVAPLYRACAKEWGALAAAALPDAVPAFRETRALLVEKWKLFVSKGDTARPRMQEIEGRLAEIAAAMRARFPLDEAAADALRGELSARILRIHAREADALAALSAAAA